MKQAVRGINQIQEEHPEVIQEIIRGNRQGQ